MECNKCNKKLIRHVRGNTLTITVPLQEQVTQIIDGEKTKTTADFVPSQSDKVVLRLTHSDGRVMTFEDDKLTVNGNMVTVTDNGTINCGMWGVEVLILCASGRRLRFFSASVILVVNQTAEAGIDDGIEYNVEEYELEAAVFNVMRGFSAYEIWLQHGHVGTESDFLEWLRNAEEKSAVVIDNDSVHGTYRIDVGNDYTFKNPISSCIFYFKGEYDSTSLRSTVITFTAGDNYIFRTTLMPKFKMTILRIPPAFISGQTYMVRLFSLPERELYLVVESTLQPVAYSGSYNDLKDKPAIPDVSDYVPTSLEGYATETWVGQQGYLTEHQDISGKEDKVAIATTLPATLEVGTYYRLGPVGTLSAALPTVSDTEHAASIIIGLTASADITPALTASVPVYYQEGFEIKSGGVYEINCLWNGSYWSVTTIKFETA